MTSSNPRVEIGSYLVHQLWDQKKIFVFHTKLNMSIHFGRNSCCERCYAVLFINIFWPWMTFEVNLTWNNFFYTWGLAVIYANKRTGNVLMDTQIRKLQHCNMHNNVSFCQSQNRQNLVKKQMPPLKIKII